MTEKDAIRILGDTTLCTPLGQATFVGIEAINEVQQYRSIGTISECREAMEKQKPIEHHHTGIRYVADNERESVYPNCLRVIITNQLEYPKYCTWCGQHISWEHDKEIIKK